MKNFKKHDVVIIGGGPAGLTCAIYAARGNLDVLFIEKGAPGGKMTSTYKIENWSGNKEIKGYELAQKMFKHAKDFGAKYKFGNVLKIENYSEFDHKIFLESNEEITTKAIVIASGMINKIPSNIKNLEKFSNKGLSYCVVCDGAFYKNKPAAIIGGGDSAFEESIYLSSIASHVYIFVNTSHSKAEKIIQKQVKKIKNISIFYNASVIEMNGNNFLESILVDINGEIRTFLVNHLYPYIGFLPSNEFAKEFDIFDNNGFILTDENMETKIKGLYAIGDIRKRQVRQIITAASDGAIVGKILTNKIKK